jgi:tRNA(Arg) A34 adenosine deaminase TadA
MRHGITVEPYFKEVRRSCPVDYSAMLVVVLAEARKGLDEGGIPIGAAIFDARGGLIGAGHNRLVQNDDLPCTRN